MNTQHNTPEQIPQWAIKAAEAADDCLWGAATQQSIREMAAAIMLHAPRTAASAQSIWRPVSVRPTIEDCSKYGWVLISDGEVVWCCKRENIMHHGSSVLWCPPADLLALAPLPKEKTQEELDNEFMAALPNVGSMTYAENERLKTAIAYGRATARGGNAT